MYRRDVLLGLTASFSLAGASVFPFAATEATSAKGMVEIRRHIRRALSPILRKELTPQAIGRRYLSLHP
jgi:hypothetical protein